MSGMVMSSCVFSSQIRVSSHWNLPRVLPSNASSRTVVSQSCASTLMSNNIAMLGQQVAGKDSSRSVEWNFLGGSRIIDRPNLGKKALQRSSSVVYAAWLTNCQIASSTFTLGTIAVLPFYTSMVVAPRAEFTKKLVSSSIPYIVLGVMYAYLLYLSWTPDTIQLMFASKYLLPELSSISKMFSSQMTLASAWVHLLVVDLFAARQVYQDGLQDNVETRHSVSLCLMFCPIGILAHFITKALKKPDEQQG